MRYWFYRLFFGKLVAEQKTCRHDEYYSGGWDGAETTCRKCGLRKGADSLYRGSYGRDWRGR